LKNKSGQTYRVKEYTDIKPDKTYKKTRKAICTSLEEWAMCLLKPDLPKKLQEATDSDDKSKQRWAIFQQRMDTEYSFDFNQTMAPKGKQPTEQNTDASVEIIYADLTVKQIYQTIQKGLQQGQLLAKKLKSKKQQPMPIRNLLKWHTMLVKHT
jgi:hypothetical protein